MSERLSKQHVILLIYLLTADIIPGHDKIIFTFRHQLKNLGASNFYVEICALISPFLNQLSHTTLCLTNHILVPDVTCSIACWHHLQRDQSNCNFFATYQITISTYNCSLQGHNFLNTAAKLSISLQFLQ